MYGSDFGRLTQFVHKLRQFEDNWKANGCCLPILQRNQVNEKGNVPRCGVVPTFSDVEVVALSITAEAMSIDSENYLFKRLNTECPGAIPI